MISCYKNCTSFIQNINTNFNHCVLSFYVSFGSSYIYFIKKFSLVLLIFISILYNTGHCYANLVNVY